MAKMYQAVDSDGDGVLDANDAYPNDPNKAYNTYYPGINTFGSVAFEDLWPAKGDYDFNDMVVDYKYNLVTNAANKVVEMDCDFVLRAIGASYSNGFGFQLNCSPSVIQSVTGTKLTTGKIGLSGNGTEAGQTKAVVVLFDNAHNLMQPMGGSYINTEPGKTYITPVTFHVVITFSTPQAPAWLGSVPFNPFIFINGDRGKEVHLPNNPPTTLVNNSYFKTVDDYSLIGSGTYYKSKNNLPWALNIPVTFDYPIEKAAITSAYPYFGVWAESNGLSSTNWYTTAVGNRITSKIYSK